jgi:hypothetical protein
MAHFAKIENGIVTEVIAVGDEFINSFIDSNLDWVQTYKDNSQRYNYAGIGYIWDGTGFAPPQPFPSWNLDLKTYLWNAPTPKPTEGRWRWDEPTLTWIESTL